MQQVVRGYGAAQPLSRPYSPARFKYGGVPLPPWLEKKQQRPYFYGGNTAGGNTTSNGLVTTFFSPVQTLQIDRDSHFLCEGIGLTATSNPSGSQSANFGGPWTLQVQDLTSNLSWSNLPIPQLDIAGGTSGNFSYFKDPFLIRPSTILRLNTSLRYVQTNVNSLYYVLYGRKVYDLSLAEEKFFSKRHWYQYAVNLPTTLTHGNVLFTTELQLFSDSDFVLKRISCSEILLAIAQANSAAGNNDDVLLNIRDTSIDRSFFTKKISLRSVGGAWMVPIYNNNLNLWLWTNAAPFEFERPIFIKRNSILELTIENPAPSTNLSFSTDNPGTVTFEGIRIFD